MKHYAIDQWADFTQGLLAEPEHTRLEAHLKGGCQECLLLWAFTTKLIATCTGLATDPVPESAVRLALAIFPVQVRLKRPKKLGSEPTSAKSRRSCKRASAKQMQGGEKLG
jgi:hypothetical protein